jgi:hypothetical protein
VGAESNAEHKGQTFTAGPSFCTRADQDNRDGINDNIVKNS